MPLEELETHRAGHELLGLGHKGVERLLERAEPLAVVHAGSPGLLEIQLLVKHVALEREVLEGLVRRDEGERGGHLVALAALQAHHTVLHKVKPAIAVVAGNLVELLDKRRERHLLSIERHGHALLEIDVNVSRRIGGLLRVLRHDPHVVRGLVPGILEHAAFDRATPQVVIDGVGVVVCALGHRNAVLVRVGDLIGTALEIPFAHRRDNLKIGIEREDRRLEAHLVVTLARAAMRNVLGIVLMRDVDEL